MPVNNKKYVKRKRGEVRDGKVFVSNKVVETVESLKNVSTNTKARGPVDK